MESLVAIAPIVVGLAFGYAVGRFAAALIGVVVFAAIFAVAGEVDAPRWAVAAGPAVAIAVAVCMGVLLRRRGAA